MPARRSIRWGKPGLEGLVFCALVFATLFGPAFNQAASVLRSSDTAWLIRTGEWILSHRALPSHNPLGGGYPELEAIPIVCYQWLFEVILAGAHQALGLHGVVLLVAVVFGLAYVTIVCWLSRRRLRSVYALLAAVLVSVPVLSGFDVARPMLASLLMTALLVLLLDRPLSTGVAWLVFPAFFLVWANLHLGFIAGLAILAAFQVQHALEARTWRPLGIWGACVVATFLNPYGVDLYAYFWRLANSPFMNANIQELQSGLIEERAIGLFVVLAAFAAGLSFRDPRIRPAERWLFPAAVLLTVYSARHVYLLAVIALPFIAVAIDRWLAQRDDTVEAHHGGALRQADDRPVAWILGGLVAAVLAAGTKLYPANFPGMAPLAGAIDYLERHVPSRPILTDEEWGSYLTYGSRAKGYLDSRMDMYGDDRVRRRLIAYGLARGWPTVFRELDVRYALYPPDALPARHLEQALGWRALYRDAGAVLLVAPDE